jgi:hypothetical protein
MNAGAASAPFKFGRLSRLPDKQGGCFIKGTRVHTREGLKAIEAIQVGDYVLSSLDDGSGKSEYRQVVNTFKHLKKRIFEISHRIPGKSGPSFTIAATGNHPFWVDGIGWTRADELKNGQVLRVADGSKRVVDTIKPVYRTKVEGVGWIAAKKKVEEGTWGGCFDYENYADYADPERKLFYIDPEILNSENPYLEVTVYNLEVDGYHTYFVDGVGIWVHSNCAYGVPPVGDKH